MRACFLTGCCAALGKFTWLPEGGRLDEILCIGTFPFTSYVTQPEPGTNWTLRVQIACC